MRKLLLFLIIVLGLLQFRLWFGDSNLLELEDTKQRLQELKQRAHDRKELNAALEAEIMDLKRGTDAIEERARLDLGMVREGEHFIQVLENPLQENSEPENNKANRPAVPRVKPKRPSKSTQHAAAETPAATASTTTRPQETSDSQKINDE
jgi:cell division protein FtsB